MFWFFGHEACGILAPQPGIEPAPPALESEILTTGPPGKSPERTLLSREDRCSKIKFQGSNRSQAAASLV